MENNKSVLVISPDVPFPDNYGGALDIWKRVVYLKGMGFTVHLVSLYRDDVRLEAFENSPQFKMVDLHIPVKYSARISPKILLYPLAMTIRSIARSDLQRLQQSLAIKYDYALVENSKNMLAFSDIQRFIGMQCNRIYVRMQNCEWEYYDYMASAERNILKKIFFITESIKFKFFEKNLAHDDRVDSLLFISDRDKQFYGKADGKSLVLPVFLSASEKEVSFSARKNMLLFIGNLELADNVAAVEKLHEYLKAWLMTNPDARLVIAGKNKSGINPFSSFTESNVEVMFNIPHEQKERLINEAKVFCSFSMNPAGVKLKTLEGASAGLPILANNNACDGSGLESVVMNIDKQSKAVIFSLLDQMMADVATFRKMSVSVSSAYQGLLNDAARAHAEVFS